PSDAGRELLVGAVEVLEQLLVGGRLLEGVELSPVEVLEERVAQEVVVLDVADDRRDGLAAGELGRPPAPLTHDELVPAPLAVGEGAHDDRLQDADLADRGGEL